MIMQVVGILGQWGFQEEEKKRKRPARRSGECTKNDAPGVRILWMQKDNFGWIDTLVGDQAFETTVSS